MNGTVKYLTYKLKAGRICAEGKENSENKVIMEKMVQHMLREKAANLAFFKTLSGQGFI